MKASELKTIHAEIVALRNGQMVPDFLACGKVVRSSHVRTAFYLPLGLFDQWCDAVSDDEKLKLYHLLRNGEEKAIQAKTEEMMEVVMKQLRFPLK